MTDEDWYKVLAVNLSGAFFMSKAALEHMFERGTGRIVNISSIIGQIGNIGQANYAASKSGLFGLTTTLAREAAHALHKAGKLEDNEVGVTVNAVAPGFIETDMLASVPDKVLDGIRAQVPAAPARPPRRDRPGRPLPVRRRLLLHHRPGVGGERRARDVGRRCAPRRQTAEGRRQEAGRRGGGVWRRPPFLLPTPSAPYSSAAA